MKYDWLINKPHRGTVNDILWPVTYPLRNIHMACGSSNILSVPWIILKHLFSNARDIRDVLCSALGNCVLKINLSTEWQLSLCDDISRGTVKIRTVCMKYLLKVSVYISVAYLDPRTSPYSTILFSKKSATCFFSVFVSINGSLMR